MTLPLEFTLHALFCRSVELTRKEVITTDSRRNITFEIAFGDSSYMKWPLSTSCLKLLPRRFYRYSTLINKNASVIRYSLGIASAVWQQQPSLDDSVSLKKIPTVRDKSGFELQMKQFSFHRRGIK